MNKKRESILFVVPSTGVDKKNVNVSLPLQALYIGSEVEKEYDFNIIDLRLEKYWKNKIKSLIKNTIAIGITTMTGQQITSGLECAKFVREINPNVPIIWGGIHPSIDPIKTIKHTLVDYVVIGEGEKTFLELLNALKNKSDLNDVDGICFQKDDNTIITKEREFIDLNERPIPDYKLLNVSDYITTEVFSESNIMMLTSRGCPHNCMFCYNGGYNKGKYRTLTPENFIRHLQYIIKNFNIFAVIFNDDNFFVDKKRVEDICNLIIKNKLNVTFKTTCRIEYIVSYSKDFLSLMKKAGFIELYLGVESGSNKILSFIKKGCTKDDVIKACMKLKEVGIVPKFSFMAGFPKEEKEDIIETLDLMVELIELNKDAHCTPIQLFSPYPKTELFDISIEDGLKIPKTFEGYGKSNWNEIKHDWLSNRDKKFLEKMSFATFFLDGKSIAEYFKNNIFIKTLNMLYGFILRLRIKYRFYYFMPETYLIKRILRY